MGVARQNRQQGNACRCFQHPYRRWNSPGIILVKEVFASHAQAGAGGYSSKWVSYFSYQFAFSCADKMGRVEGMSGYFDDGTTYIDRYYPKPWQAVPMAPKTNWTTLMEFVCAWKSK